MATETLKLLTGIGEPLIGRVIVFDALTGTSREVRYARDPARGDAEPPDAAPTAGGGIRSLDLGARARGPAGRIRRTDRPVLLDVREPYEVDVAALPGAVTIPLGQLDARLGELDPAAATVVYCHLGVRSATALTRLEAAGFTRARHLTGGIDAWSRTVDTALPRY